MAMFQRLFSLIFIMLFHTEHSERRSRSSHSPMPAAVETVPVDQSFPIAKLSRGSSEKRKERRYRGGGDSGEEREREKERDRSSSKRARPVSPLRGQVSKSESLKRSSSGRNSPQFWERERSRREEERYARDLRHVSDESHSLRRPEERREDSRRGSFQHEKDDRQYRELRRGDSRRARIEEREHFARHDRYDVRPRSPRRPDRLDRRGRLGHIERDRIGDRQSTRERQHLERGGRHAERERRSRERERHRVAHSFCTAVKWLSEPKKHLRLQFLIAYSMQKWTEKAWGISSHDPRPDCHMSSHLLSTAK